MGYAEPLAGVVIAVVGGRSLWEYLRDRRKAKAEGTVAAATVELQIDAQRLENVQSRLAFTEKAWDEERQSLERRINLLERDLAEERLEGERKDQKILELQQTVTQIQNQLLNVSRELADLRRSS